MTTVKRNKMTTADKSELPLFVKIIKELRDKTHYAVLYHGIGGQLIN